MPPAHFVHSLWQVFQGEESVTTMHNTCMTEHHVAGGWGVGVEGGGGFGKRMQHLQHRAYCGICRTADGGSCIRNIKASLPNIDRSGSASLAVALAIGIAMSALGGIFLCIAIIILYKWRKVCSILSGVMHRILIRCFECFVEQSVSWLQADAVSHALVTSQHMSSQHLLCGVVHAVSTSICGVIQAQVQGTSALPISLTGLSLHVGMVVLGQICTKSCVVCIKFHQASPKGNELPCTHLARSIVDNKSVRHMHHQVSGDTAVAG